MNKADDGVGAIRIQHLELELVDLHERSTNTFAVINAAIPGVASSIVRINAEERLYLSPPQWSHRTSEPS